MIPTEAYPLSWPIGRPRTRHPRRANFETTQGRAIADIQHEVKLLGGTGLIISSNFATKRDGMPYANQSALGRDCGVAVYFIRNKKPMCFACDQWNKFEHNLRAVVKTIEALRGIARWGTGDMVEQAFSGFTALPAPTAWWQTLELEGPHASKEDINDAYRRLAMKYHPDRPGGEYHKMMEINRARDLGLDASN